MIKSSFKTSSYNKNILLLCIYGIVLCLWGKVTEYFGSFLTITACIYAPLAALLFVDFFFVRKQKISLRSAYDLEGYNAYNYTNGINIVGFICVILGVVMSLAIYNPVSGEIHNMILFYATPTGFSFLGTGILYYVLSKIPIIKRYILKDRNEITI